MNTIQLLKVLAVLVAALGSPLAAQDGWYFLIDPDSPAEPGGGGVAVGVSPDSIDNYDSADSPVTHTGRENFRIYHSAAEGWLGPEGFYRRDIRAPIVSEKTWANLYLWWAPGYPMHSTPIYFYPAIGTVPAGYRFTLYLDRLPAGVTYNGPWQWQINPTAWGGIPAGTFTPFASETGLDGYRFHLTVVVPEPSGIIGVGGPLALAGLWLRGTRRRR